MKSGVIYSRRATASATAVFGNGARQRSNCSRISGMSMTVKLVQSLGDRQKSGSIRLTSKSRSTDPVCRVRQSKKRQPAVPSSTQKNSSRLRIAKLSSIFWLYARTSPSRTYGTRNFSVETSWDGASNAICISRPCELIWIKLVPGSRNISGEYVLGERSSAVSDKLLFTDATNSAQIRCNSHAPWRRRLATSSAFTRKRSAILAASRSEERRVGKE